MSYGIDNIDEIFVQNQKELDEASEKPGLIVILETKEFVNVRGSKSVWAWHDSNVRAYDNVKVRAFHNANVEAYDSSIVSAIGNSIVKANNSAMVIASEESIVWAYDYATVEAHQKAMIVRSSDKVSGVVFDNTQALLSSDCSSFVSVSNGKTKTVTINNYDKTVIDKIAKKSDGKVILYKCVNPDTDCDFYSGKIKYEIGKEVVAPDWDSNTAIGCGHGLHLCFTAIGTLAFYEGKILKCLVSPEDITVCKYGIESVRCRAVTPIAVVNIRGEEI